MAGASAWRTTRTRVPSGPEVIEATGLMGEDRRDIGLLAVTSADRLNALQFLTIRRYLSLVFATLVTLLLVLAIWS